jgi:hypothetical protein
MVRVRPAALVDAPRCARAVRWHAGYNVCCVAAWAVVRLGMLHSPLGLMRAAVLSSVEGRGQACRWRQIGARSAGALAQRGLMPGELSRGWDVGGLGDRGFF